MASFIREASVRRHILVYLLASQPLESQKSSSMVITATCTVLHSVHVPISFLPPTAVDGLSKKEVKALAAAHNKKAGDSVRIVGESGRVWGAAYQSTDATKVKCVQAE